MNAGPLLQRVMLKNCKSIEACNVELGPLAFLVGLNGSGKSNFIDALRFVADSLRAMPRAEPRLPPVRSF
jgi:predicted ATPase